LDDDDDDDDDSGGSSFQYKPVSFDSDDDLPKGTIALNSPSLSKEADWFGFFGSTWFLIMMLVLIAITLILIFLNMN